MSGQLRHAPRGVVAFFKQQIPLMKPIPFDCIAAQYDSPLLFGGVLSTHVTRREPAHSREE
jgi:hypothetical protein